MYNFMCAEVSKSVKEVTKQQHYLIPSFCLVKCEHQTSRLLPSSDHKSVNYCEVNCIC